MSDFFVILAAKNEPPSIFDPGSEDWFEDRHRLPGAIFDPVFDSKSLDKYNYERAVVSRRRCFSGQGCARRKGRRGLRSCESPSRFLGSSPTGDTLS